MSVCSSPRLSLGLSPLIRLVLALLLFGAGQFNVHAQQDPAFIHYWRLETQWNPAAVGRSPQLTVSGAVQTHANGYTQAGSTMWAGADLAFRFGGAEHGVGAAFTNDAIGLFSHKRFALQYALHRNWRGGRFSLGVQADMLQEGIDGGKADLNDGNDPAFPTSQLNGSRFDLSAGAAYTRPQFGLSASLLHLTAPTVEWDETHRMKVKSLLNFSAHYNIRPDESLYTIIPSAMLRVDLTLRGEYSFEKRRLFGGVNYAPGRSVALLFGGTLRGLDIAYSYEAFTSGLGLGAGQHEISVVYRLPVDLGKKGRNLHRSVRWL